MSDDNRDQIAAILNAFIDRERDTAKLWMKARQYLTSLMSTGYLPAADEVPATVAAIDEANRCADWSTNPHVTPKDFDTIREAMSYWLNGLAEDQATSTVDLQDEDREQAEADAIDMWNRWDFAEQGTI
jgi:hypothetical protein